MQRIRSCFVRQHRRTEDTVSELASRLADTQNGHIPDESQPSLGGRDVSASDFVQHEFRDMKIKPVPMPVPPFARKLLMGQAYDIAARPGREVTDDVAVEICRGCHTRKLPQVRVCGSMSECPARKLHAASCLSRDVYMRSAIRRATGRPIHAHLAIRRNLASARLLGHPANVARGCARNRAAKENVSSVECASTRSFMENCRNVNRNSQAQLAVRPTQLPVPNRDHRPYIHIAIHATDPNQNHPLIGP